MRSSEASAARKRATAEDVRNAPEGMTAELVDGELFMAPRPAVAHAKAATGLSSQLFMLLDRPAEGSDHAGPPEAWHILSEPEIHVGGDIFVPDIAGWRRTRVPALPASPFISITPDWVCEVFSPSSYIRDRLVKASAYQRHGVPWIWYVDPSTRFVEVWHNTGKTWELVTQGAGTDLFDAPPFEGATVDLRRLWDLGAAPE